MKKLVSILFILLFLIPVMNAQDPTEEPTTAVDDDPATITYGETVSGEITDRAFEIEHYFQGVAGEVVVVEMENLGYDSELESPSVLLLDPEFNVLAAQDSYASVRIAAQLPADGEYTIVATRRDGRAGESLGEYNLTLQKPETLELGSPAEGAVTDTRFDANYFTISTADAFTLTYEKGAGDFYPSVKVSGVDEDGAISDLAILEGLLSSGSISMEPQNFTVNYFVVVVEQPDFYFSSDNITAQYTLTLTPQE